MNYQEFYCIFKYINFRKQETILGLSLWYFAYKKNYLYKNTYINAKNYIYSDMIEIPRIYGNSDIVNKYNKTIYYKFENMIRMIKKYKNIQHIKICNADQIIKREDLPINLKILSINNFVNISSLPNKLCILHITNSHVHRLPKLPKTLKVLIVRLEALMNCKIGKLPKGLKTLKLENCSSQRIIFPNNIKILSLINCDNTLIIGMSNCVKKLTIYPFGNIEKLSDNLKVLKVDGAAFTNVNILPNRLKELYVINPRELYGKLPNSLRIFKLYAGNSRSFTKKTSKKIECDNSDLVMSHNIKIISIGYGIILKDAKNFFDNLPNSLKKLEYLGEYNKDIRGLPDGLTSLEFGKDVTSKIINLPLNLKYFNTGNIIYEDENRLTIMLSFFKNKNNRFVMTDLDKLKELTIFSPNFDIKKCPKNIKKINTHIDPVNFNLPEKLEELNYYYNDGKNNDKFINFGTLPKELKKLRINGYYYKINENMILPKKIEEISIYGNTGETIPQLPKGIKYVNFGCNSNIDMPKLPDSIQEIIIDRDYQDSNINYLPNELKTLIIAPFGNFGYFKGNINYLPDGLKALSLNSMHLHIINTKLPDSLIYLRVGKETILRYRKLPKNLRILIQYYGAIKFRPEEIPKDVITIYL